jgi:hypothetical protein
MEVTLSYAMHCHIWKPSAPGSTPTGWTPLDLSYDERNCFLLRFTAAKPHKRTAKLQNIRIHGTVLAQMKQCDISVFPSHSYWAHKTRI